MDERFRLPGGGGGEGSQGRLVACLALGFGKEQSILGWAEVEFIVVSL